MIVSSTICSSMLCVRAQMVAQDERNAFGIAGEKDRRALIRHAEPRRRRRARNASTGWDCSTWTMATRRRPLRHVLAITKTTALISSGIQPPSASSAGCRGRRAARSPRNGAVDSSAVSQAPAEASAHDLEIGDRRDDHRHGDGESVGVGEPRRTAEADDERDAGDGEQPVDERDVDLAAMHDRRVDDAHARDEAETDRLFGERKDARDQRLRRDDRRDGRDRDDADRAPGAASRR